MDYRRFVARLLALLVLAPLAVPSAEAQDAIADFYRGKQMRIVVGSEGTGGFDIYARAVARHIGQHIPGNPNIIVQNMPGAGSLVAANAGYVTLPQDGTIILALQAGALFEQILGNPAAQYQSAKFQWLGSLNQEPGIAVTWHSSKVKKFEDLAKEESIFGTAGANITEQYSSMLIHLMGAKIKQVRGYPSVVAVYGAIEKGEVEGITTSWVPFKNRHPHWFAEKKINVIAQLDLYKQPDLPEVPLIMDLITEKNLLPEYSRAEATAIWTFMLAQQTMFRPYGLGPGVPADRVAALRKAFAAMAKDKVFLEEAEKAQRDINFTPPETMQALLEESSKTPKSTLEKIGKVTTPK
jgi:tripartite-type tricarboxylate transporter receptor subunit TctC